MFFAEKKVNARNAKIYSIVFHYFVDYCGLFECAALLLLEFYCLSNASGVTVPSQNCHQDNHDHCDQHLFQ